MDTANPAALARRFAAGTGLTLAGFDAATLARGDEVLGKRHVLWFAEPVPGLIEGDVRGSGRRIYQTAVTLRRHEQTIHADVRCSCPIARQCKHGAALVGAWLAARPPATASMDEAEQHQRLQQQRQQAMQWVRRLPGIDPRSDGGEDRADAARRLDYRLWYVLVPERRQCRLRVFRLRPGPAGRLLSRPDDDGDVADRPDDYPLLREAGTPAAADWNAVDRRVAAALAGAGWQPGRGLDLDVPHARAVLFDLAREGRLYLYRPPRDHDDPPLTLAEARPATIAWDDIGELGAQLGLAVGSAAGPDQAPDGSHPAQPLYLAEPAWVDRLRNTIGPLDVELPPTLLDWLRSAPPVPHAVALDVATALRAQLHARPGLAERIPAMPGAPVHEIRPAPVPVLGLFMASSAPRRAGRKATAGDEAWLVVSLAVDYAGQRMEPLRAFSVPLQTPAGPALIVTDHAAEAALRDTLIERLEDLDDDATITFSRERTGGRTGWLTIGSLPADSLAAIRLRHDLTRQLAAAGWQIRDQTERADPVLDAADASLQIGFGNAPAGASAPPAPSGLAPSGMPSSVDAVAIEAARQDWFALDVGIRLGDRHIDLAPLLADIVAAGSFDAWQARHAPDGIYWMRVGRDWLRLPVAQIETVAREAAAWAQATPSGPPGERAGPAAEPPRLRIDPPAAARLATVTGSMLPERLRGLAAWLQRHDGFAPVTPSPAFASVLRPYQQTGVGWLQFIAEGYAGGILADDMGLGKTVQVLAHLDREKAAGRLGLPALIVAPTSVVRNWAAEARRHAPALRTLTLTGPDRLRLAGSIADHDLVLTSYALLPRDLELLARQPWQALVMDEAQWVKNSRTRAAGALRQLIAAHRIALTGTPVENHLGELWSILDLAMPGLLGDEREFRRRFRLPIERGRTTDDAGGAALGAERTRVLLERIRPFVLRRTKDEVLADLPERTEIVQRVDMGSEQRDRYEALRVTMDQRVREALARADSEGGRAIGQGRLILLDALLKLRQMCCDPALVRTPRGRGAASRPPGQADPPSAKKAALIELLATLASESRKALVFSQFTTMLDLIEAAIDADPRLASIPRSRLDGDTADRTAAIDEFQQGDARIFLLSLKAGGVGLNLTAADTVILYDPWWNPAVERQATDRAHRIGQTQPVFVYKLVISDSIEEQMLAMQAEKADLAEAVLSGLPYGALTGSGGALSREDLLALLCGTGHTA